MDLRAEALRLTLDALAVEVSAVLADAAVPHVLLKGPSTALWLYDPPRTYRDVDLLIPLSALPRARSALSAARLAGPAGGRVGEEAPHSLLLRSTSGYEIDVHLSLPTVPLDGDRVWRVLADHVEPLDLVVGSVPVLDEAGRCLVLALHALNNGPNSAQPLEDLVRARAQCPPSAWAEAAGLAERIGAADLFAGALAMVDGAGPMSARARLYAAGAPSAAFGLQRLASARARDLPRMLWREIVPSRGFMYYDDPHLEHTRRALAVAHLRRWRRLLADLPLAARAWWRARRNDGADRGESSHNPH